MEIKQDFIYKGTRILFGDLAEKKVNLINHYRHILRHDGFREIIIPIIQFQSTFNGKVGNENHHMMYNFTDAGNRDICLAPEYTAVIQKLANTQFKHHKDVKMFYVVECFRGEKPQAGRYRQFTQLGVEIINPSEDYTKFLSSYAKTLTSYVFADSVVSFDVARGLDYYTEGKGFEITEESLGAQKQICGGGSYEGGIGFAIGIDRLILGV